MARNMGFAEDEQAINKKMTEDRLKRMGASASGIQKVLNDPEAMSRIESGENLPPEYIQELNKTELEADLGKGKKFGQEILGQGLGRLSKDTGIQQRMNAATASEAQRAADVRFMSPVEQQNLADVRNLSAINLQKQNIDQVRNLDAIQQGKEMSQVGDVYQRMQNIADKGLSRQELQAEQEMLLQETGRAQQTASRRMQGLLANSGVQGAVAGRQLMDIESQGMQQRSNIARDLFLKSEQMKREGTQNLANLALQRQTQQDQRNQAFQQLNLQRGTSMMQAEQARSTNLAQLEAGRQRDLSSLGLQRETSMLQAEQNRSLNQANLNLERAKLQENIYQGRIGALEAQRQQNLANQVQLSTFDLGQAAKEKSTLLQAGLGFAALGAAERGSDKAAQATAQAAAAQSSGGKIICTELHRQGLLNDDIMQKDQEYGVLLRAEKPHVYAGYVLWAQYVVLGMKKSKLFTKLVLKIAKPWALNMAYNNNKLGKVIAFLGEGLCGIIGKVVTK